MFSYHGHTTVDHQDSNKCDFYLQTVTNWSIENDSGDASI